MIEELREYLVPIGQMTPGTVFLCKGRQMLKLAGVYGTEVRDGWNVIRLDVSLIGRVVGRIEQTPGWFKIVREEP